MAGLYQALLTLNFATAGVLVGTIAALHQLMVGRGQHSSARLVLRRKWLIGAALLLLTGFVVSLLGSVALALSPSGSAAGPQWLVDLLSDPLVMIT